MAKINYSIVAFETDVFSVVLHEEPPKVKKAGN